MSLIVILYVVMTILYFLFFEFKKSKIWIVWNVYICYFNSNYNKKFLFSDNTYRLRYCYLSPFRRYVSYEVTFSPSRITSVSFSLIRHFSFASTLKLQNILFIEGNEWFTNIKQQLDLPRTLFHLGDNHQPLVFAKKLF